VHALSMLAGTRFVSSTRSIDQTGIPVERDCIGNQAPETRAFFND
jgi:hypothetical protein